MTREELSRINRKTPSSKGETRVSGFTIVLTIVLLLNVMTMSTLIYLTIEDRSVKVKREEQIEEIQKQLTELGQLSESQKPTTKQPVVTTESSAETTIQTTESSGKTDDQQAGRGTANQPNTETTKTKKVHVVAAGDTLSVIATEENVEIERLRTLNNLSDDVLQVGQELVLE